MQPVLSSFYSWYPCLDQGTRKAHIYIKTENKNVLVIGLIHFLFFSFSYGIV